MSESYKSTFGFDDPPTDDVQSQSNSTEVFDQPASTPSAGFDLDTEMLRLMQLQKGRAPEEAFTVPVGGGPVSGQFTAVERPYAPGEDNLYRLMLGVGAPLDENFRLGAQLMAQQDPSRAGSTVVRPALNLGYGPLSLNAGYQGVATPDAQGAMQFAPTYGLNLNLPVAGGQFSGGISKTGGQPDPYLYAAYQRAVPFLGGDLGFELSSADRLRNLAALLSYKRVF
jgi:hypothetical protein